MSLEHQGPALKPCSHVTKFSTTFWLKFPSIFLPTLFGWRIEFQAKFAPTVADPGFSRGGGANSKRSYYLAIFPPKTA